MRTSDIEERYVIQAEKNLFINVQCSWRTDQAMVGEDSKNAAEDQARSREHSKNAAEDQARSGEDSKNAV